MQLKLKNKPQRTRRITKMKKFEKRRTKQIN